MPPTQVNGFTGERTTTFYGSCEIGRNVRRSKTAAAAESQIVQSASDDLREACRRFGALFSRAPLALPVVRQEVGRIDDELREVARSPSRALVEVGALKARTSASSPWRRLGRGDRVTLRAEGSAAAILEGEAPCNGERVASLQHGSASAGAMLAPSPSRRRGCFFSEHVDAAFDEDEEAVGGLVVAKDDGSRGRRRELEHE